MRAAKSLLLTTLAVIALCHNQTAGPAAVENKPGGMTAIINTVTIKVPPKAVFDLITTARLWPQWHPATKAVGGVVERPYGLGD
jgi:Polyketide cyclase / dehydrase and lipid transport